jgi:hypothetical protein
MLDHARSLVARVQERNRFPTQITLMRSMQIVFSPLHLERQKLKNLFHEHDGVFNFTCDCWSDSEQEFLGEFTGQLVHPHVCTPFPI